MKILALHGAYDPDQTKRNAVDQWRIARPLAELRKHVDWQIDERQTLIPEIQKYKHTTEFTSEELEKAFDNISGYDIVWSSYQANPTMYTLLKVAADRTGTQYIMDADDHMFAINPTNPVWLKLSNEQVYFMQRMIADNTWISTTTDWLAHEFVTRRPGHTKQSVFIMPNYISDAYHAEPFENAPDTVIGFFGGSSHYEDLHTTGVLPAIQRLMHENKHIRFRSIGMPIDHYIPRGRFELQEAKKGDPWLHQIFPTMHLDIAIGPLEDNPFNWAKSNIKWQEATRAGSAFVASNIGPYSRLLPGTAALCQNNEETWYRQLKRLVDDVPARQNLVAEAQRELQTNWRLEDNWRKYQTMFETVYEVAQTQKRQSVT